MQETHYPYSRYLREVFGAKVYKISITSGLSCPVRDGAISRKGCAFCDEKGSASFFGVREAAARIREQIDANVPILRQRFRAGAFLAYFQSYTNTHAPVRDLERLFRAALGHPEIRGLCIGTRPDCLGDDVLELLERLGRETYVSVELGIQSFDDPTLQWLERGHDAECAITSLERLRKLAPSASVCAHLILGCPTEPLDAATRTAEILNSAGIRGVKLHQLMILKHTRLAERWQASPFPLPTIEEYAVFLQDFIETLSPRIYLERLFAGAPRLDECLAPGWSRKRWEPHNRLRALLGAGNCTQGVRLKESTRSERTAGSCDER